MVERSLDSCIGNQLWLDYYNQISISTLSKVSSDHYPLLLELHINPMRAASQFKFLKAWTLHKGCKDLIAKVRSQKVVGCNMFILTKKLQLLKKDLKGWNKNTFGDVSINVKMAEAKLSIIQQQIQLDYYRDNLKEDESLAQHELSSTLAIVIPQKFT